MVDTGSVVTAWRAFALVDRLTVGRDARKSRATDAGVAVDVVSTDSAFRADHAHAVVDVGLALLALEPGGTLAFDQCRR